MELGDYGLGDYGLEERMLLLLSPIALLESCNKTLIGPNRIIIHQ